MLAGQPQLSLGAWGTQQQAQGQGSTAAHQGLFGSVGLFGLFGPSSQPPRTAPMPASFSLNAGPLSSSRHPSPAHSDTGEPSRCEQHVNGGFVLKSQGQAMVCAWTRQSACGLPCLLLICTALAFMPFATSITASMLTTLHLAMHGGWTLHAVSAEVGVRTPSCLWFRAVKQLHLAVLQKGVSRLPAASAAGAG